MALTEAEKRQALRERRAAKMANSNARLQKITGDSVAHNDTSSSSPPPSSSSGPTTSATTSSSSAASTPLASLAGVASTQKSSASKSFSQTSGFASEKAPAPSSTISAINAKDDDHHDPPVESIEEFQKSLENILGSQKHQHTDPLGDDMNEMDMFAQLLGVDPSKSGADHPLLAMMKEGSQETKEKKQNDDIDYELAAIEKQKNDKFKAWFMLIKFLFTFGLCLYFFFARGHHSTSYQLSRSYDLSLFTQIFTGFEVVTTSYFASVLHKLPHQHYNYNSKILDYLGMIPDGMLSPIWKNRVKLGFKYFELLQLVLFDISVIVVVFGVLSFMH